MRIGLIPTINKRFLIHTREWEQRGNLGLQQVKYDCLYNYVYHIISLSLPRFGENILRGFGLLVIYRIIYFGGVFDLVFQTCKNFGTYVFSNYYGSLINFIAVLFSMWLFKLQLSRVSISRETWIKETWKASL